MTEKRDCPDCNGTGKGQNQWDMPDLAAVFSKEWICSRCFGKGTIPLEPSKKEVT
jgi:DnaJ-class molecular chaperone